MPVLELDPDYLEMLILKVRAVMGKEPAFGDDYGSNPIDEDVGNMLAELPGDLSREEVIEEIQGLGPRKRLRLVALMWLGRGDGEAEDWDDLLEQAAERQQTAVETYLLADPLLADYWAEGLEKLGPRAEMDDAGTI